MSILGITDLGVILAYAGSFLSVAFCIVYSLMKGREPESEDETDD